VEALQWSPSGRFLCSVGGDMHHTLILYEFSLLPESSSSSSSIDFKRFSIKTHARAHAAVVSCCAWPPAALGASFVTCGDKHVKLWEVMLLLQPPPLLLLLLLLLQNFNYLTPRRSTAACDSCRSSPCSPTQCHVSATQYAMKWCVSTRCRRICPFTRISLARRSLGRQTAPFVFGAAGKSYIMFRHTLALALAVLQSE
jgi:WD40 repeat protein